MENSSADHYSWDTWLRTGVQRYEGVTSLNQHTLRHNVEATNSLRAVEASAECGRHAAANATEYDNAEEIGVDVSVMVIWRTLSTYPWSDVYAVSMANDANDREI